MTSRQGRQVGPAVVWLCPRGVASFRVNGRALRRENWVGSAPRCSPKPRCQCILAISIATGLTTGAIYALIALGIVIVYRATNLVNFAHGEMFMIAGFLAWTAHVTFGLSYLSSLVVSVAATFLIGIVMYLFAYKPLMQQRDTNPILLVMIGLSFVLRGVAREIWGGKGDYLTFPPLVSPEPIQFAGLMVMSQQFVVLIAAIAVMIVLPDPSSLYSCREVHESDVRQRQGGAARRYTNR